MDRARMDCRVPDREDCLGTTKKAITVLGRMSQEG